MSHQTAEDARRELIAQLGDGFGGDLYDLEQEYINLRIVWRFYRSFFATNSERVELLNKASGLYFYMIEQLKFEAVLLGICRLTDPVETGRGAGIKLNLTVRRLEQYLDGGFVDEWSEMITQLDANINFARDWRNRKIAHSSYDLQKGQVKLEGASREKVEAAFDAIEEIFRFVRRQFLDSEMIFEPILTFEDEVRVLEKLFDGLEVERANQEALEQALSEGNFDDFERLRSKPNWLTERP
ncbi:hypothetical protein LCL97_15555 [Seohaeicola saemankumensis]|nr:hypothetical protein [Seohaeicola saemankumensis]MCA0872251.1 hypothetical protein [Seohaeicola saemankumensis]